MGYRAPQMLADHGLSQEEINDFAQSVYKDPLWEEFDLENIPYDEIVDMFVQKYPEKEELIRWVFSHTDRMHVYWPEVWEKVHALKQTGRYKMYLLSNYSSVFFKNHLTGVPVLEDMDGGVISYQVHQIKPHEDIYRTLMAKYALQPETCIFFDDRADNVEAARKIGMQAKQIHSKETILEILDEYLAETAEK